MNLVADEKKRREQENRARGIPSVKPQALQVPTPAEAQAPVVLSSNESIAQAPAPDPMTPAPVTRPAQRTGPTVAPFDPKSGREKPKDLGFYAGWWRDRVRENLTDKDGDGIKEIPFWWGVGNSITDAVGLSDRSNEEIRRNERDQRRDREAREISRGSGVADQIPMEDGRLYDPQSIQGRVNEITRGRDVADREDGQQQDLNIITETNKPAIEEVRSGERQNNATNQSNERVNRDTNRSNEQMNSDNNRVTTRGQDKEYSLGTLGMQNELDIAEIQRLANADTIRGQNELSMNQYRTAMEQYQMDRQDRKDEREEDRRQDALSALLAGLTSLGVGFSL